jgi:hypothetical protein
MTRRPAAFKQSDVARAVKGVLAAGVKVTRVEVGSDGKISITSAESEASELSDLDHWRASHGSRTP